MLFDLLEDRFEVYRYHYSYWSLWYNKCNVIIELLEVRYSNKRSIFVKSKFTETNENYRKK